MAPQDDNALVQGCGHLSASRAHVLRQRWQRHRRFSGTDEEAGLPAGVGHQCDLAAAVLSLAVARRRLRHRGLYFGQSKLRNRRRLQDLPDRGAQPAHPRDHRTGAEPYFGSASVVSGSAKLARQSETRLVCLERDGYSLSGCAHHFPGHGNVQLGLGSDFQIVLLAPVFQPPAGLEFR